MKNNEIRIKKSCKCGNKNHTMSVDNHPKTGVKMTIVKCDSCLTSEVKYG